jgi:hypothetical protein
VTAALTAALRACAAGFYPSEAGTGLLIGHGGFLSRPDFGASITGGTTEMAEIDWHAVITALHDGHLPVSDLLTELPGVAAAQEASRPCGRSSRCPKHPDCQVVAARSPA